VPTHFSRCVANWPSVKTQASGRGFPQRKTFEEAAAKALAQAYRIEPLSAEQEGAEEQPIENNQKNCVPMATLSRA